MSVKGSADGRDADGYNSRISGVQVLQEARRSKVSGEILRDPLVRCGRGDGGFEGQCLHVRHEDRLSVLSYTQGRECL